MKSISNLISLQIDIKDKSVKVIDTYKNTLITHKITNSIYFPCIIKVASIEIDEITNTVTIGINIINILFIIVLASGL